MKMNAAATLLAGHDPRRTALVCAGEQIDRGALRDAAARAAGAWCQRGLAPGERVAIMLPDSIDWVIAWLGVVWAGGVAVAVNPRVPPGQWSRMVDEAGFRFILAQTRDATPTALHEGLLTLAEWRRAASAAEPIEARAMEPDAPAFWSHSSGTSGAPKAVVHAQRCALQVERVAAECLGVRPEDRLYASSKLFFVYPLANSLMAGLKLGASVVLDPQWPTAATVADSVAAARPSVFFSVPSLYRDLLAQGLAPRLAASGLTRCVSAGEALPAALREQWLRCTGLLIVDGYGASETLCLVLLDHGNGHGLRPAPGVTVTATGDRSDEAMPTRVRVQAPSLALGYWQHAQAQAEHFCSGGFCPGDLFVQGTDGGWRFAGREDALVKIGGRWVNLVEIEQRLEQCAGIAEAAAVALADDDGVAAVALFYAPAPGAPADIEAALRASAEALPPHQRPRLWQPLPALPRTATGKLLRRQLQRSLPSEQIAGEP